MKKLYALFAATALSVAAMAQTALPYEANWKYKAENLAEDGTLKAGVDENAGKPDANQDLYDLAGWNISGLRPFYIPVSNNAPIANTMEFVDGKQEKEYTSFLVSPALDFSKNSVKTITFNLGKEKEDQNTSVIDVLYTTEYNGDPAKATWNTLKEEIIPAQGMKVPNLGGSEMVVTELSAPTVYIAIKARKATNCVAGEKQAKIRITKFQITEEEKTVNAALPYQAVWSYKAELINAADSTFIDQEAAANAGGYKDDPTRLELNGWTSVKVEGDRWFCVAANKNAAELKRQIPNTVEWSDNKQAKANTTWFVSPKINFAVEGEKTINFQIGREKEDQQSSNMDLLYSTDYIDDVKTATWTTIKTSILPKEQVGLQPYNGEEGENFMHVVAEKVNINADNVTIAFKARKEEGGQAGEKQAKIRIHNFNIQLEGAGTSISNTTSEAVSAFVANGELNLIGDVAKVELYNIAGLKAMEAIRPTNSINVSNLTNGIYVIRLTSANGQVATHKVIVK